MDFTDIVSTTVNVQIDDANSMLGIICIPMKRRIRFFHWRCENAGDTSFPLP